MKKTIIIINGRGGVGKDTFVSMCQKIRPDIHNISSIDFVKEFAHEVGWSGQKTEKDRKFLSDLKRLLMEYNASPFYAVFTTLNDFEDDAVVFLHVREPSEISAYKQQIRANGDKVYTVLVKNDNVPPVMSNDSDANVEDYNYDLIIDNSGTLNMLRDSAETFIEMLDKNKIGR